MPVRRFDLSAGAPHSPAMRSVIKALAKAFGQLSDGKVLGVLAKSVVVTILVFALMGVGLYFGLVWLGSEYSPDSSGLAEAAAAVILVGLAFWFLFRVVALAVLQFFADEIVAAVEVKHYPMRSEQARPLPFRRDLANSLRGIGRALAVNALALPVALILLVTGIGPALVFLAVNAWLLGRELTDMAWLRHCGDDPKGNPVSRYERTVLGAVIAGIMLVPIANLFAPILGAAAGTHLTHRALSRGEAGKQTHA